MPRCRSVHAVARARYVSLFHHHRPSHPGHPVGQCHCDQHPGLARKHVGQPRFKTVVAELSARYHVHRNLIGKWKRMELDAASDQRQPLSGLETLRLCGLGAGHPARRLLSPQPSALITARLSSILLSVTSNQSPMVRMMRPNWSTTSTGSRSPSRLHHSSGST